jgi:hypothetical protein
MGGKEEKERGRTDSEGNEYGRNEGGKEEREERENQDGRKKGVKE